MRSATVAYTQLSAKRHMQRQFRLRRTGRQDRYAFAYRLGSTRTGDLGLIGEKAVDARYVR
jgi:hypothetical protein